MSHLNGLYHVRDPTLLTRFLRVRLLERQFDSITYIHIPRNNNHVAEYSAFIELLRDAISHGVLSLEVRLDSKLVVS